MEVEKGWRIVAHGPNESACALWKGAEKSAVNQLANGHEPSAAGADREGLCRRQARRPSPRAASGLGDAATQRHLEEGRGETHVHGPCHTRWHSQAMGTHKWWHPHFAQILFLFEAPLRAYSGDPNPQALTAWLG